MPSFAIGFVLIMIFAVELQWLPAGGRGEWFRSSAVDGGFLDACRACRALFLPASRLAFFKLALVTRLARAGAASRCAPTVKLPAPPGLATGRCCAGSSCLALRIA
ncbi:hypothetical protein SCANM63S_00079 [Streptomyces canarius]